MKILSIYTTQRNLKRKQQIPMIVKSIIENCYVEPILLALRDDGSVQVENGHHRLVAYYLAGRDDLKDYEYVLLLEANKNRIASVAQLAEQETLNLKVEGSIPFGRTKIE